MAFRNHLHHREMLLERRRHSRDGTRRKAADNDNGGGDIGNAGLPMPTAPPDISPYLPDPSSLLPTLPPSVPPLIDPYPPVGAPTSTPPQNTPPDPGDTGAPTRTSASSHVVTSTSSQVSTRSSSSSVHPSTPSSGTSTSSHKLIATQSPTVSANGVSPSSTSSSTVPGAASASASASASTNSHPVAAGVVVGLIALGALVCVVVFAIRRYRRNDDGRFDANDFRRSAFPINDPPAHADTAAQGFNPRPPTMIERKLGNSPVVPGAPYGDMYSAAAADHYNVSTVSASDSNGHTQGFFAGGQMANPFASPPPSPRSFAASYATAGHSQLSLPSSVVSNAPQPPLPLAIKRPTRPASGSDPGAANGFTFPRRNTTLDRQQEQISAVSERPPANDYVDLDRSSVSPFQAAQYEAISRQLSRENPHSFGDADTDTAMGQEFTDEAPPVPPKTPFDHVGPAVAFPSTGSTDSASPVPANSPFEDPETEREAESQTALRPMTPELQDFPVPPSPVPTVVSRYRVDSVSSTPPSNRSSGFHDCAPSIRNIGSKYQPSPLAACGATVGNDGLETGQKSEGANTQSPTTSSTATSSSADSSKIRPDTVYNIGDAYGGI